MSEYAIDKTDVWVEDYELPACDKCEYSRWPLRTVLIDIRGIGSAHSIGDYCEDCLPGIVKAIRDNLPEPTEEVMDDRAVAAKEWADKYVDEDY